MSAPSSDPAPEWRRTNKQKAALLATAALTLGAGLRAFWLLEGTPRQSAPLSFHLSEVKPEESGIEFVHEKGRFASFFDNVLPFMQAVSAAACTTDFDRDGLLDRYFVNSGHGRKNKLFRNLGGFRFEHVPLPVIEDLNEDGFSSDCLWADLDNDGFDDLFVGAVGQRPRFFWNRPGAAAGERTFVDFTEEANGPDYMNGFAAVFFDVERDGDLDLLQANYFPTNYRLEDVPGAPRMHPTKVPKSQNAGRMMPNDWGNADNGGRKRLFLNDGSGRFEEQDAA